MNIHMQASKEKLRFDTDIGILMAESLWDLPISVLDSLTVGLKDLTEESTPVSYLDNKEVSKKRLTQNLRFKVAESILLQRIDDLNDQQQRAENKLKRDKLLILIASKEAEALGDNDLESLKKMADDLL